VTQQARLILVVILVLFLGALTLLLCCPEDDRTSPGAASVAPPSLTVVPTIVGRKVAEFGLLRDQGVTYSATAGLSKDLLERSIRENRTFPSGNDYQRYTYAIKEDDPTRIIVAIWNHRLLDIANPTVCAGVDQEFDGVALPNGAMVNFFPEKGYRPGVDSPERVSPCWIARADGSTMGLLDALNKHFLLAQDSPFVHVRVEDYEPDSWKSVRVLYAGEIIVNVRECYYMISNRSGTFAPDAGTDDDPFANLNYVAATFASVLGGVPPLYLWGGDAELSRYRGAVDHDRLACDAAAS